MDQRIYLEETKEQTGEYYQTNWYKNFGIHNPAYGQYYVFWKYPLVEYSSKHNRIGGIIYWEQGDYVEKKVQPMSHVFGMRMMGNYFIKVQVSLNLIQKTIP